MPNLQPTYTENMAAGFVGRVATSQPSEVISRIVEGSAIAFGRVVVKGTDGATQCKDGSANTSYMGIALVNIAVKPANLDAYAIGDVAAIMIRGVVWVVAAVTVAYGDQAYFTAGGVLTNVSTSATIIPGGKFDSAGTAGNVVKLRLA